MSGTKKSLLDGYVGVKFRPILLSGEAGPEASGLYPAFRRACERLREHDMTPANGGNMSVRRGSGFVVSSSGCNLGCIEPDELVLVEQCDVETQQVRYRGRCKPSSESIMHWLIYRNRHEALAVIHAHDLFAARPGLLAGQVEESAMEEPYGTVELARMAIATFERAENIIVLKNHGYVAVGPDLATACDLVVCTHLRLLERHTGERT